MSLLAARRTAAGHSKAALLKDLENLGYPDKKLKATIVAKGSAPGAVTSALGHKSAWHTRTQTLTAEGAPKAEM